MPYLCPIPLWSGHDQFHLNDASFSSPELVVLLVSLPNVFRMRREDLGTLVYQSCSATTAGANYCIP